MQICFGLEDQKSKNIDFVKSKWFSFCDPTKWIMNNHETVFRRYAGDRKKINREERRQRTKRYINVLNLKDYPCKKCSGTLIILSTFRKFQWGHNRAYLFCKHWCNCIYFDLSVIKIMHSTIAPNSKILNLKINLLKT